MREQNWLDNYQSAKRYAEKKGTLLVPAGYVDESGFRLGVWISNLRAARKARPESFQVTPEHIAMLEARKQYAWYLKGVPHANYYKEQIVRMNTLEDMERITAGIKRDLK